MWSSLSLGRDEIAEKRLFAVINSEISNDKWWWAMQLCPTSNASDSHKFSLTNTCRKIKLNSSKWSGKWFHTCKMIKTNKSRKYCYLPTIKNISCFAYNVLEDEQQVRESVCKNQRDNLH